MEPVSRDDVLVDLDAETSTVPVSTTLPCPTAHGTVHVSWWVSHY